MTFLQLALGYVIGRMHRQRAVHPGVLPRRSVHVVRAAAAPLRPAREERSPAVIFLVTRSLADGIRLFATALVIAVVTSVPVPWIVVVLGAAMIVYTVRGGVSAVIWTDVVQMFVYVAGAPSCSLALLHAIPGGWAEVVARRAARPASSRVSTCRSIRQPRRTRSGPASSAASR